MKRRVCFSSTFRLQKSMSQHYILPWLPWPSFPLAVIADHKMWLSNRGTDVVFLLTSPEGIQGDAELLARLGMCNRRSHCLTWLTNLYRLLVGKPVCRSSKLMKPDESAQLSAVLCFSNISLFSFFSVLAPWTVDMGSVTGYAKASFTKWREPHELEAGEWSSVWWPPFFGFWRNSPKMISNTYKTVMHIDAWTCQTGCLRFSSFVSIVSGQNLCSDHVRLEVLTIPNIHAT